MTTKVLKLQIIKPCSSMEWTELGKMLRDVRYRVFRLANMAVSEKYRMFRQKAAEDEKPIKISELNKELAQMLAESGSPSDRYTRAGAGAVARNVINALSQNKLQAVKWTKVLKGEESLPSFRHDMSVPIRCDEDRERRLERTANGDVEVDLKITMKPYPRVVLGTRGLSDGARAVLERLLENSQANDPKGYRQRCFEIKERKIAGKSCGDWFLFVTYDFPSAPMATSTDRVVGVDVGYSCPLVAAVNDGFDRLGRRDFGALAARVRATQRMTFAWRRARQRGGKERVSGESARSGHGRRRKLQSTEKFWGKIDNAYTTLNHTLSAAVVKFAASRAAGVIQIEKLDGLKQRIGEEGAFLRERWRYEQLQRFITYKAQEAGIQVREVDPRYTSRRCSECGEIHYAFKRKYRDAHRANGQPARFECPACGYKTDPDYNAARNLAVLDIDNIIAKYVKEHPPPRETD